MSPTSSNPADAVKEEIAREISSVHLASYGERATNLRVAVEGEMVAVMMDIALAAGERTLVEAGRSDAVRTSREAYQEVIEGVFVAIVERATGRRVVGFASRAVIGEPIPWSTEVFRLAEAGVSRPDPR